MKNINQELEIIKKNYITHLQKNINPDFLCNICFAERVNIVINPCGHLFCLKCVIIIHIQIVLFVEIKLILLQKYILISFY